jgi:hypothetical protein
MRSLRQTPVYRKYCDVHIPLMRRESLCSQVIGKIEALFMNVEDLRPGAMTARHACTARGIATSLLRRAAPPCGVAIGSL